MERADVKSKEKQEEQERERIERQRVNMMSYQL